MQDERRQFAPPSIVAARGRGAACEIELLCRRCRLSEMLVAEAAAAKRSASWMLTHAKRATRH